MGIEQDLAAIAAQEARLQFPGFDAAAAWRLGSRLREAAAARNAAVTLDIWLGAQQLFFSAMPGTSPDNAEWARRKRNVVLRFHRSSYAVGLELTRRQTTLSREVRTRRRATMLRTAAVFHSPCAAAAASAPSRCPDCRNARTTN